MKTPWQQTLKRMKLDHIKASAPGFFQASGGYTMAIKPYTDKTSNGLTKCIIDFLTFKGHYANRISTQGQARVHKLERYNISLRRCKRLVKQFNGRKVQPGKERQISTP